MDNNKLQHYGVIGMKWGVRRGNTAKAYEKASKKLQKIDKKYTNMERKAIKASVNADRLRSSRNPFRQGRGENQDEIAKRRAAKVSRYARNGSKWLKSMEKVFKNTNVSLTAEQRAMGEKYAETLRRRAMNRYL